MKFSRGDLRMLWRAAAIEERVDLEAVAKLCDLAEKILDAVDQTTGETANHDLSEVPEAVEANEATWVRIRDAKDEELSQKGERISSLESQLEQLHAENERLKAAMDRSAQYWEDRAQAKFADGMKFEKERRDVAERASAEAGRKLSELRAELKAIVNAKPRDAHRLAKVAFGRDILRAAGALAREGYVSAKTGGSR